MNKRHIPHGRADADTRHGELRKPDDYSDQPGQRHDEGEFAHEREPDRGRSHDDDVRADAAGDRADVPVVGTSAREYGHSSGDRNRMRHPQDWHGFSGGIQRDASPAAPRAPGRRDAAADDGADERASRESTKPEPPEPPASH